jgi:hypothetical protein
MTPRQIHRLLDERPARASRVVAEEPAHRQTQRDRSARDRSIAQRLRYRLCTRPTASRRTGGHSRGTAGSRPAPPSPRARTARRPSRSATVAGGAELQTRRQTIAVSAPRLFRDETRADVRVVERLLIRLVRAADFLELQPAERT